MFKDNILTRKRRAMTSEDASRRKRQGHRDEELFADLIEGVVESGTGKRDVIDRGGGVHSVKGADKKWQIFLYGRNRFLHDRNIPGARIFIKCIDCFPDIWDEYKKDKQKYKHALQPEMRILKDFLSKGNNKRRFFEKAFLNGEIDYLTIKEKEAFHIFDGREAIKTINKYTEAVNSKARTNGQTDDLKVVFKVGKEKKTTIGEIELRTDRNEKFKLVKLWMFREKTLDLLKEKIKTKSKKTERIIVYGKAINNFLL